MHSTQPWLVCRPSNTSSGIQVFRQKYLTFAASLILVSSTFKTCSPLKNFYDPNSLHNCMATRAYRPAASHIYTGCQSDGPCIQCVTPPPSKLCSANRQQPPHPSQWSNSLHTLSCMYLQNMNTWVLIIIHSCIVYCLYNNINNLTLVLHTCIFAGYISLHSWLPEGTIPLYKAMYSSVLSSVRVNDKLSDWFSVDKGVKQGCLLSPALFSIYINDLILEINGLGIGIQCDSKMISTLVYADDIILLAEK